MSSKSMIEKSPEKCSAVSTMERNMPEHDYSKQVDQLRELIIEDIRANPGKFSESDVERVYKERWFVERYLLRMKLDVKESHEMLRKALEFRNSPTVSIFQFPREFYKIGALFHYEPDRKGNVSVWMRVRIHQKIALVQRFLKAFLFRTIERADQLAKGKGIVLIFDLQGVGLQNIDMDLLFFFITTLVNFFPKGLSYMLVHELPWYLRSCWQVAKQWLSEDHKELVKFSDSRTIYEYFAEESLPDFMGGTCKRDYRAVPDDSITISQVAKQWNLNESELKSIKRKFAANLPPEELDEEGEGEEKEVTVVSNEAEEMAAALAASAS